MSAADAVERAYTRLREAGAALRERPAAAVHDALADVLDAWSASDSPWRSALVEQLPEPSGFSPQTLHEGLLHGLASYTGASFRALVREELGGPEALDATNRRRIQGFETTATILGGAIPLPTIVAVLAPLALRAPVLVKTTAYDPSTVRQFARSLAERDPLLGACVESVDFRRDDAEAMAALCHADCVVATGSDAAMSAIARVVTSPRRFVAHGHRFSLVLLGPDATREDAQCVRTADAIALDVALWDQLGCLSPGAVVVVEPDAGAADRLADALADALARLETRMPRGRIEPAAAARIFEERAQAEVRAATDPRVRLLASSGTSWTVVREADLQQRPAPLHRFVRVHPANDPAHALAGLHARRASLAAVAIAGFGAADTALSARLLELGASRICAPGRLQAPPLAWPRDGFGVLTPFVRIGCDERKP
jgi:hypothetical protein